jgi:hypothetical protein
MSWPWRRRNRDQQAGQDSPGEPPLRGPQPAYYQRLTGAYSKVSSNGELTLTATHVIFDSKIGKDVTVALADVHEVRDQKIRRVHVRGHDSQLVIATGSGEIGFLLEDPAAWAAAIGGQLQAGEGLPPEGAST